MSRHPTQLLVVLDCSSILLACLFGCWLQVSPADAAAADNSGRNLAVLAGDQADGRRQPFSKAPFDLEQGDVVAFLGGADVVAMQDSGHLEALLTARFRTVGAHFRNFGWEGDTVVTQPRDVGFPPLRVHLQRAGASVIVLQYGRGEALSGRAGLPDFKRDYGNLLDECARQTPRLLLVTPPPFERGGGLLPDLSQRNKDLAVFAQAVRELAQERNLPLVDLFSELGGESHREPQLTSDGLQFTPRGQAYIARAFVRQLGFSEVASAAGEANENGVWLNSSFEQLRQAIVEKNRLWFDYWRPENWAFLGGDRTEQPSSRDYRNPKIRWFPSEMERFVPLIEAKEREIAKLADKTG